MSAASVNFPWEAHHFIAGVSGLDFANTVVWRHLPERRQDRVASLDDLAGWARAAGLPAPMSLSIADAIVIRDSIDALFRMPAGSAWSRLLTLCAEAVAGHAFEMAPGGLTPGAGASLETVLLHSAVALALSPLGGRVRVCGNCGWLFVDRTRNGNKRWCIPDMCGSRVKARRHYARRRAAGAL